VKLLAVTLVAFSALGAAGVGAGEMASANRPDRGQFEVSGYKLHPVSVLPVREDDEGQQ
jgi:hypothetical protein